MSLNLKEMGLRIKNQRNSLHLTREQLSETINISSHYLYEIESGKKTASLKILLAISQKLNISIDYIVCGTNYSDFKPEDKIHIHETVRSFSNRPDRLTKLTSNIPDSNREKVADIIEILLDMTK